MSRHKRHNDRTMTRTRIMSIILAAAMSVPFLPLLIRQKTLRADTVTKNETNTSMSSSTIFPAKAPATKDTKWTGDYVWYGSYEGDPIKFRVLSPSTTAYGGTTMFLDCDRALFKEQFNLKSGENKWSGSHLQEYLNGDFLKNSFGVSERNAIATSIREGGQAYSSGSYEEYAYGSTVGVNDKVFVLDASEILNKEYGYYPYSGFGKMSNDVWLGESVNNHKKLSMDDQISDCWLRSASTIGSYQRAGSVERTGGLGRHDVNDSLYVSPAINLDLRSVVFSTRVKSMDVYGNGAEFKLSVLNKYMTISVTEGKKVTRSGKTIFVPYTISGSHAEKTDRISVLILNRSYKPEGGAMLLYYRAMDGLTGTQGTATFDLPDSLSIDGWGEDYYVYILAENLADGKLANHLTDYVSAPVLIAPVPEKVTGLKAESAGKNKVELSWDPVSAVEGYLVYAQKNGNYDYVGMTTWGTTFTDTKALDTDYNFYWVFGYVKDANGKMIPGGCEKYVYAKGVCLAVTGLKASSVSGGVKLTWNASEGAKGYLVYGIHPGGSYGYIGMTTKGTTFTDKKASKTDWNFYWVFPYHKNGDTMVVGGTPKYVYGKAK